MRALGEYMGRQNLFSKQAPEILETLKDVACVESTESSTRLEGIHVRHERVRNIVLKSAKPKGRSEEEVAGYKDALEYVHQNWEKLEFDTNTIRLLHGTMYRYTGDTGGSWKTSNNVIVDRYPDGSERVRFRPTPWAETPSAMEKLVELYNARLNEGTDPLLLIPLTVLDFLCIHPFTDGNGRVARLITLLLLYKAGYHVGRYISLERVFEQSEETYYETLETSSARWHSGRHDALPWTNYFWGVLTYAYKEFEERVAAMTSGRGTKTELVTLAISRWLGPFSIADIERKCPNVPRDTLRHIFHVLRDEGRIRALGKGRGAKWEKVRGKW
ncbi:MAG: Fic family protein [Candidatus Thermoplasmatota archaeon]